ncbi:TIGR04063 family PEP-CTERM/XrtA system glycosyltransferase, partial [Aquisalimonas sp.]|uniref:TIGR04063 family PEP-CTERM/XrtA system glycosyltransferase n=1 Tax=Aquisalimonas sp. TaxID=1872621 RepID=UPI0025BA9059
MANTCEVATGAAQQTPPSAVDGQRPPLILHVLDHSLPLQSGYTFRTLAILQQQRRLGWLTEHLTGPKQGPGTADAETVDGWHFHRTPWAHGAPLVPGVTEWRSMAAITRRLDGLVRDLRPDVIHAHSPALNAVPALRVGKRHAVPVVYEVRAFWEDAAVDHGTTREGALRYRLTRGLETWALRRADAVTTICEGLRQDILARGIPPGRVTVIPNAVDLAAFSGGGKAEPGLRASLGLHGRVLGFIGSFYAYEGLPLLLQALPRIRQRAPDVKVLLVGGGPEEERLRTTVTEQGLEEHVVFTGRVPHDEVQRYYDLIDVLVYPRLSMRLTELVTPLKPLEAMAQGRLLVASDVGGHRELIQDGQTGVLFRAGDAESLAERVTDLMDSEGTWAGLRQRAAHYVDTQR